jgi:acetyl-CoA carboxylase carboxyl transferase subunit beta
MAWFKKKPEKAAEGETRIEGGAGLWVKCNHCRQIIYRKELERNERVCPKCAYHFPISVDERIQKVADEGSFVEHDRFIAPGDPLQFKDMIKYKERLKLNQKKTGHLDALVIGEGRITERPVILGVFNFSFMAGSMGSVVGEKLVRGMERALADRRPLIIFSTSGGARMQEGILSLMQMAKTSAAVARLQAGKVPFISVLTDPTFGGVTASFAMLGDFILAEPKALIGFAGPRVIEKTIRQALPEGFQRAEFLLEHGMIDMIVERKQLRATLSRLLSFFP